MNASDAYRVMSGGFSREYLINLIKDDYTYIASAIDNNLLSKEEKKKILTSDFMYPSQVGKLLKAKKLSIPEREFLIKKVANNCTACTELLSNSKIRKNEKDLLLQGMAKSMLETRSFIKNNKSKFNALTDDQKNILIDALIKYPEDCYNVLRESRKGFYREEDIVRAATTTGSRAQDIFTMYSSKLSPESRKIVLKKIATFKSYLGTVLYNYKKSLTDDDKKVIIDQIMETKNIECAALAYQWMECTDEIKEQFEPMALMVKLVKAAK